MKRRDFLKRAAMASVASAAVTAQAAPVDRPDAFVHNGWIVKWYGWFELPHQRIAQGYWSAHRIGDDSGTYWACTAQGVLQDRNRYEILDTTMTGEWPILDGTHTPADMAMCKRSALERLLAVL